MIPRRSFEGTRCLVTGADSDLGRAIAGRLAVEGANVLLTGRSLDQLEATARSLANRGVVGEVLAVDADLDEAEGRNKVIHAAASRFGALDLAINVEDNPVGLIEMTRALRPLLKLGASPALVNIGPIASSNRPALAGFTESLGDGRDDLVIPILHIPASRTRTPPDHGPATTDRVATRILEAIRRRSPERLGTPEGWLLRIAERLMNHRLLPVTHRRIAVSTAPDRMARTTSDRLPRPHFGLRMNQPSREGD